MYIMSCLPFFFLPYFVAAEVQSPLIVEKELLPMHDKKREEVSMQEEEFPKENGKQRSNGIGAKSNYGSDRNEGRQPDVMDDHPGKFRSTFQSCHTSVISYAYHFFQIWYFIKS